MNKPKIGGRRSRRTKTISSERIFFAILLVSFLSFTALLFSKQLVAKPTIGGYNDAQQAAKRPGLGTRNPDRGHRGTEHDVLELENATSYPESFQAKVDEQWLHGGRVIRELSHRVLKRSISQSNVVILSPRFSSVEVVARDDSSVEAHYYTANVAIEQGHRTHLLPASTILSEGWQGSDSVGWILLAYIATDVPGVPSIDEILSFQRATSWLEQTTITYIVFPVSAKASLPLESLLGNFEYDIDLTRDLSVEMVGLGAAGTLMRSSYKIQLLSSSHHFDWRPSGDETEFNYGPNSFFHTVKSLHRFLYHQVSRAMQVELKHMKGKFAGNSSMLEVEVHSLLFATQGLDLAIPSRSSYTDVVKHNNCVDSQGRRKQRCDPKLNARALNESIFLQCPERHGGTRIQLFGSRDDPLKIQLHKLDPNQKNDSLRRRRVSERTAIEKRHGVVVDVNNNWLKEWEAEHIEIWSSSSDPDQAEAACVNANREGILPRVDCATRIVQIEETELKPLESPSSNPNLLVIMIDPLSRYQLRRSLPNTWAILKLLGFVDFERYTAVGNNSGPNQAALYSGRPIDSRDGIKSSGKRSWLWDRLKSKGYITMKAEDGCVRNSNMVQSIQPRTHHGRQLHEFFCFSFDRPNCLGSKMAAEHLIEYTQQFIDAYEGISRPWAAFVSFVDSHEDTLTLASYLDGMLAEFVQSIPRNTVVLFTSDHGLHYGPPFSARAGEVERSQPLLMMKMPTFQKFNVLTKNADKYTTPFDAHETLSQALLGERGQTEYGLSLLDPLPAVRNDCTLVSSIPASFCALVAPPNGDREPQCRFMAEPPSVFSYFADIPLNNRPRWPKACPLAKKRLASQSDCLCASDKKDWHRCSSGDETSQDNYSLRSCGQHDLDSSLEVKIHVKREEELAESRRKLAAHTENQLGLDSSHSQPNILFIEVDSVSLAASERHFRKTWSLLKQYAIGGDGSCQSEWCAAAFNQTSVVGQSSIVNQLAALSGCLTNADKSENLKKYPKGHCPIGGQSSLGINNKTSVAYDHWLFDVAERLGYITFFGEEFCYEESPYVVQNQSPFTLRVDLSLERIHCQFAKNWLRANGKTNSDTKTWAVEYDSDDVPETCFDGMSRGEMSLEFIRQMWDVYSEPKFAFLNVLAAHDYSIDPAHTPLSAENYDLSLYEFLSGFVTRQDARETLIVLRSDHGLQGGPWPIDYSVQIEHMRPWTTLLFPRSYKHVDKHVLAINQERLTTGFDIYNTLRFAMTPSDESASPLLDAGIPRWSFNLFKQEVPRSRTCFDAKIPLKFCPCVDERGDVAPSFYVGQSEMITAPIFAVPLPTYNWERARFEPARLPGETFYKKPEKNKYHSFALQQDVKTPGCNATLGSYIDENMLSDSWQMIQNITSLFPASDVSGGIFLYERQALLLAYLVQRESASMAAATSNKQFVICETGFGSGHGAALFLSSSPNVQVISFDKYDRPYQSAVFYALRSLFGSSRLMRVVGDSCSTVKQFGKKCDFIHGSSLCRTDNIDLIYKSGASVKLTSTAMAKLTGRSVYFHKDGFGKTAQWEELRSRGCIKNSICFKDVEKQIDGDLLFARRGGKHASHQFCFAESTGVCVGRSRENEAPRAPLWSAPLKADEFCPDWIVPVPPPEREGR